MSTFDMNKALEKEFDRSVFDMLMKDFEDDNNDWNYEVFKTSIHRWRELQHLAEDEWDCDAMRGLYYLIMDVGVDTLTFLERDEGKGFEFVGVYPSSEAFAESIVSEILKVPDWIVIDFEETASELANMEDYYYVDSETGCYVFQIV